MDKEAEFRVQSGNQTYTDLVLDTFAKMDINSNHDLNVALNETKDSPQLAKAFVEPFKHVSGGLKLSHKEGSFFRCAAIYMDSRWIYDHEYF